MPRLFRIPATLIGAWAILMLAATNSLAAPAALVIDIVGAKNSSIEAFTEIEAGGTVDLGADGRLEFLDYNSCKNVVIIGGVVSFTARRFSLRGGKIIDETRGRCPKVISLSKEGRTGGVRLRSPPGAMRLSARPLFAFTGSNSGSATQMRITPKDAPAITLPIVGRQLRWPEGRDGLANGSYELEVLSGDGTVSKRVPFEVAGSARKGKMTIIRMN